MHFRWLFLLGVLIPALGWAEIPPQRQAELMHLLKHDCGSCHGMTFKGGLGSALTPSVLAQRPTELLLTTILDGRSGTPMPPWRSMLTREEAAWLVEVLRAGAFDD